jgi:hypothetical protein
MGIGKRIRLEEEPRKIYKKRDHPLLHLFSIPKPKEIEWACVICNDNELEGFKYCLFIANTYIPFHAAHSTFISNKNSTAVLVFSISSANSLEYSEELQFMVSIL